MSQILLVAWNESEAAPLAGFAAAKGDGYDLLVLSGEVSNGFGANRVLLAGLNEVPPADAIAAEIARLGASYSSLASAGSMAGKDVMARVAALMDAGMVTDVIEAKASNQFVRPIVAGTILATVETLTPKNIFTIRTSSFKSGASGSSPTERVSLATQGIAKIVASHKAISSRPELAQAKVVVSGGRPLKDAGTFERLIGGLADKLGGAVGATRAAVDSGIAPNECQVGQTGKIVAPELYIAAGISGSTQHMAGIKDSRCIVAINKDPDAPIFEFADLGLVADLYDVLPQLIEQLG